VDEEEEVNVNSKLTMEQADEIRRRYAAGEGSQHKLAREFKIGQATVYCIVNNKTYVEEVRSEG
jgi:DNA invertase Pin-like site-specific DNA recombinase